MTIAGAILPIPIWWLGRRYPKRFFRQVDLVVMLNGITGIPPATGVNYASFLLAGFVFRKHAQISWAVAVNNVCWHCAEYAIRHRNFAWWSKVSWPSLIQCRVSFNIRWSCFSTRSCWLEHWT
jgi:hypothetical protein